MYFFDVENRAAKEIAPGVSVKTFWGDQMLISHVTIAADAVVPMHSHPHEQSGIVIAGELTFTIAGDTRVLRKGDMYLIPGGVPHEARAGAETVLAMDIFSPVREEYKY